MTDSEAMLDLVSYYKGELSPEDAATVEAQLESSEACRAELDGIKSTFDALHRDLVPIELSAHFRIALADRLDTATRAVEDPQAEAFRIVRASERHIRDLEKPFVIRLYEHARRSPYFAASVLLHVAAALIILGVYFQMRQVTDDSDARRQIIVDTRPSSPMVASRVTRRAVYDTRSLAPNFRTRVSFAPGGLSVNLTQGMQENGNVLLSVDTELACVRVVPVDGVGQPEGEALLAKTPGAMMSRVQDAQLRVPAAIARDMFGSNDDVHVFDFSDRLEIWNEQSWQLLKVEFSTAALPIKGNTLGACEVCIAVLPLRRRARFV